jgi:hypothetical protein
MRFPNAVREHLRHNVVGYIALFCFAIGGTAIALPGKNKVDSGDLKPKAVHASDVANGAVTRPKLAAGAVTSPKVLDNSLTGGDIDESTLSRPGIGVGAVGPLEEADRQRRIVVPAGAFYEGTAVLATAGPLAALKFDPALGTAAYLSTEVPGGRVEGTPLEVRLIWSSEETGGDVVWEVRSMAVAVGESTAGKIDNLRETAGTTGDILTATSFTVPGDQIQSGDLLALRIFRNGDNLGDTVPDPAQLFVVEISYTSTG